MLSDTPRIALSLLLLLAVLFMPFWVSAILGIFGIIYFNFFIEALVLFLVSDLLYGASESRYFGLVFVSFLSATLVLVISEIIKKQTRTSKK